MGICFSKKKMRNVPSPTRAPCSRPAAPKPSPHLQTETEAATTPLPPQQQSQAAAVAPAKKRIFGTTPSTDNDKDKDQLGGPTVETLTAATAAAAEAAEKMKSTEGGEAAASVRQAVHRNGAAAPEEDPQAATTVRTSSCSKEEVESILIQCGRLSRNSSGAEARHHRSRKRSYDFDCDERNLEDEDVEGREKPSFSRPSPHRHRHRRTPSREGDNSEQKRSGSRERGSGSSGGRRVSRSPGRRSDTAVASSSSNASSADRSRQPPGKLVSVPAREKTSVPSDVVGSGMSVRKAAAPSSGAADGMANKRGSEVGGMNLRSASPRSRSPANPARSCNENTHPQHLPPQQPQSLSRSSSRKAEQSPYRRNPMAEVDGNIVLRVPEQPPAPKSNLTQNDNRVQSSRKADEGTRKHSQSQQLQRSAETTTQMRRHDARNGATEITNAGNSSTAVRSVRKQLMSCRGKEQRPEHQPTAEEPAPADVSMGRKGTSGEAPLFPSTGSGAEVPNPRAVTRTRSSRRSSKDLDANPSLNPEILLNPTSSYASLLLEDIHNYHHQQNTAAVFSLPACVSKACSILEAVADLNSSSGSAKIPEADHPSHAVVLNGYYGAASAKTGQVESEEVAFAAASSDDHLKKPSLHKYVTARDVGLDLEPQESAGSNSFVGLPWASPWEPNSVDSTDRCRTSTWSNNGGDDNMGGEEEFISPPENSRPKHHPKQRSGGGGFDASGRRSRSSAVAAADPSASLSVSAAAATTSSSRKTESGRHHQPAHHPGRGGTSMVGGGGSAKVGCL